MSLLPGPPLRFFLLSGSGCRAAFHMAELFFAHCFGLGFALTKIGARSGGGGFRPCRLVSASAAWNKAA